MQAIPRTVVYDDKTGSNLKLWPVDEVEKLRTKKDEFEKVVVMPGSILPLNVSSSNQVTTHIYISLYYNNLIFWNIMRSKYIRPVLICN